MGETASNQHEAYADLAGALLRAGREIRFRMDSDKVAVTLTASGSHVMRYLDQNPGASPSEVADGTGLLRSNVSAALRQLERLDFVERRTDPDDRRGARLFPTARAARNLRLVRQEWARRVEEALGPSADVGDTLALLERLADGLLAGRRDAQVTR